MPTEKLACIMFPTRARLDGPTNSFSNTHEERPKPAEKTPSTNFSMPYICRGQEEKKVVGDLNKFLELVVGRALTLNPEVMADSAVTMTMAAMHSTMVSLRPAASDSPPRVTAPTITPPMKRLMVSGDSHAWSHTSFHSDTIVDSESELGNVSDWHLEDWPV